MGPYPTPLEVQTGQQTGPAQNTSSSRVQHDPAMEPEPARYVNFLFYEGYSVEILGGKHFKTRDGEFVEMKSGTQYKILVKNSHTYGEGQINRHTILKCSCKIARVLLPFLSVLF